MKNSKGRLKDRENWRQDFVKKYGREPKKMDSTLTMLTSIQHDKQGS